MNEKRALLPKGELYPGLGITQIQNVLATALFVKVGQTAYVESPQHIFRKDETSNLKRYMHPNVPTSTIYNSQGMEAT